MYNEIQNVAKCITNSDCSKIRWIELSRCRLLETK